MRGPTVAERVNARLAAWRATPEIIYRCRPYYLVVQRSSSTAYYLRPMTDENRRRVVAQILDQETPNFGSVIHGNQLIVYTD